jgi:kynureninase
VLVDFREPDVIRVAPAPLYNNYSDAWRFARALAEELSRN